MEKETDPGPQPHVPGGGVVAAAVIQPVTAPSKVTKVIVAVHGIGEQYSFATIQSVVNQFCSFHGQPAAVPLGQFHGRNAAFSVPSPYPDVPFKTLAFAEVYWAPIARQVENEKYVLEETKKWARTLVERLRLRWWMEGERDVCKKEDFNLTQQVLSEMIQTIAVVDRLCFLADKAGIFTFDLKKLLDSYLGDVQIVAEFQPQRDKILAKFDKLLAKLEKAYPEAKIYFVSHSEGTVVTMLGLLRAFRAQSPPAWVRNVRGLMTFGSPIDKHLALWPELFGDQAPNPQAEPGADQRIEWRNYYDHGDPIGFELDSVRQWIEKNGWEGVFHFEKDHDIGFTRYPFPGKAHVDYWTDSAVFKHFILDVIEKEDQATSKPPEKDGQEAPAASPQVEKVKATIPVDVKANKRLSYVMPYIGVLALLFLAAYVLVKAVMEATQYYCPVDEDLRTLTGACIARHAVGLALLLAGITVLTRIPRLTKDKFWRRFAFEIATLLGVLYMCSVYDESLVPVPRLGIELPPGVITLSLGLLAAVVASWASRKWPPLGLSLLIAAGALAMIGIVLYNLFLDQGTPFQRPAEGPFWPIFLATAGSLYLWWLAALLFDLVFIWHLYIRSSKLVSRLDEILGTYKERKNYPTPGNPVTPSQATLDPT
jgi:hypothetical protein